MIKNKTEILKDKKYINIIKDLLDQESVKKMKQYRQHYNTNCFDHCLFVSYYTYLICKKLHFDYISAARAALLHDMFLYDWRKRENGRKGYHAFTHGKVAYENASRFLHLNDKEKDIIVKHMWPVTIGFPKYKETYIVTIVDKYCALMEVFIKNDIEEKEKEKIVK